VIDTPGIPGELCFAVEAFQQIFLTVRAQPNGIDSIALVMNSQEGVSFGLIGWLLQAVNELFAGQEWWRHLCVAFTRYYISDTTELNPASDN
jgi:hypothetical protein